MNPNAHRGNDSLLSLPLPLAALAILLGCPTAALAADAPPEKLQLHSPGGVRLVLEKRNHYQPGRVQFTVGGTALAPVIEQVGFLGGRKPASASASLDPAGKGRKATATARLADGASLSLATALAAGAPEVTFSLRATGADRGELHVRVRGVDRVIIGTDHGYVVRRTQDLGTPVETTSRQIALQLGHTQAGIVISWIGPPLGGPIRVSRLPKGGLELRLPWRAPAPPAGPDMRFVARGFRGDAILALEAVVGGPKRTGTVWPVGGVPPDGPAAGAEDGAPSPWEVFKTRRVFQPLLADPREANPRLALIYDAHHPAWFFDFAVGGDLVFIRRNWNADHALSLSFRGLITGRLNVSEDSFPLQNADFMPGLALGYRRGRHSLELFLFHESSHLGDELLDTGERTRIDSNREAVRLLWSYDFPEVQIGRFRVYAGPTFNFRADPGETAQKFMLQAGLEYLFRLGRVPLFAAVDVQSEQENNWAVNTTAQVGVFLADPDDPDRKLTTQPRLYLEYYTGHSNMGQFWDVYEHYVMLAFAFAF